MTRQLTLYTRRDCCLCEEMKTVIREVAMEYPLAIEEIDIDRSPQLARTFGSEVPVLFIDRQKAFKYRLTSGELKKKLRRNRL